MKRSGLVLNEDFVEDGLLETKASQREGSFICGEEREKAHGSAGKKENHMRKDDSSVKKGSQKRFGSPLNCFHPSPSFLD